MPSVLEPQIAKPIPTNRLLDESNPEQQPPSRAAPAPLLTEKCEKPSQATGTLIKYMNESAAYICYAFTKIIVQLIHNILEAWPYFLIVLQFFYMHCA